MYQHFSQPSPTIGNRLKSKKSVWDFCVARGKIFEHSPDRYRERRMNRFFGFGYKDSVVAKNATTESLFNPSYSNAVCRRIEFTDCQ